MRLGSPPVEPHPAFEPDYSCQGDWRRLPPELKAELEAYYLERKAGTVTSDAGRITPESGDRPCLWLDLSTRKCRHYEYRPDLCRKFEVGGDGCLYARMEQGIPLNPA
jgi:Fe-S-cluster containining protein